MTSPRTRLLSFEKIRKFAAPAAGLVRFEKSPLFVELAGRNAKSGFSPELGYDIVAASYDSSPWAKFWDRNEQPLFDAVVSKFGPIDRALDIGAGTGRYSELLAKHAKSVVAVDISENMLSIARKKVKGVDFIRSDIASYLRLPGQFNVITCARVLSHISDASSLVENLVSEHLTAGGVIVISDLHPRHSYKTTSFEVDGFRVNLDTFKHDIEKLKARLDIMEWTLREFSYDELNWKPGPHRFTSIRRESGLPIFFLLVGRRSTKD